MRVSLKIAPQPLNCCVQVDEEVFPPAVVVPYRFPSESLTRPAAGFTPAGKEFRRYSSVKTEVEVLDFSWARAWEPMNMLVNATHNPIKPAKRTTGVYFVKWDLRMTFPPKT